jgi:hypothetical protein
VQAEAGADNRALVERIAATAEHTNALRGKETMTTSVDVEALLLNRAADIQVTAVTTALVIEGAAGIGKIVLWAATWAVVGQVARWATLAHSDAARPRTQWGSDRAAGFVADTRGQPVGRGVLRRRRGIVVTAAVCGVLYFATSNGEDKHSCFPESCAHDYLRNSV